MEENEKKEVEQEETRETGDAADAPSAQSTPAGAAVLKKADLGKRAFAIIIDGVLAGIVAVIPVVGGLVAAAYMLLRDGLDVDFMKQRSLGKKLMGLRPVTLDGSPMDITASIKRNWIFAIGAIVSVVPILGLILAPLIGRIVGIVEIVLVITKDDGRRWGDQLAGTQVVESTD